MSPFHFSKLSEHPMCYFYVYLICQFAGWIWIWMQMWTLTLAIFSSTQLGSAQLWFESQVKTIQFYLYLDFELFSVLVVLVSSFSSYYYIGFYFILSFFYTFGSFLISFELVPSSFFFPFLFPTSFFLYFLLSWFFFSLSLSFHITMSCTYEQLLGSNDELDDVHTCILDNLRLLIREMERKKKEKEGMTEKRKEPKK